MQSTSQPGGSHGADIVYNIFIYINIMYKHLSAKLCVKGIGSCATLQFLLTCVGGMVCKLEVVLGPGIAGPEPRELRCLGWMLFLTSRFGENWCC